MFLYSHFHLRYVLKNWFFCLRILWNRTLLSILTQLLNHKYCEPIAEGTVGAWLMPSSSSSWSSYHHQKFWQWLRLGITLNALSSGNQFANATNIIIIIIIIINMDASTWHFHFYSQRNQSFEVQTLVLLVKGFLYWNLLQLYEFL